MANDTEALSQEIVARLRRQGSAHDREGMARFGIKADFGVSVTELRKIARELGRDYALAQALWSSGFHEARLLATLVEEPARVTPAQANRWAADFDSWDLCDGACMNVLDRTQFAWTLAVEWLAREEELVKRGGFALIAALAAHDRKAPDERFLAVLPEIERNADDDRPMVRKGASWALRQMGKRRPALRERVIEVARSLADRGKGARWVARDTLRELEAR